MDHDEETVTEALRPQFSTHHDGLEGVADPKADPPNGPTDATHQKRAQSEPPLSGLSGPGVTQATSLVRRREESERARALTVVIGLGAIASVVAVLFDDTDTTRRWIAIILMTATAIGASGGFISDRLGHPIGPRRLIAMGLLTTAAILALIAHIGIFSLAVVPLFICVYYFGMTDAQRGGWAVFGFASAGYSVLVALTLARILDPSEVVLALREPPDFTAGSISVVIVAFLALVFWLAHSTRSATLDAMLAVEHAQNRLHQREALLNEARADLDRALEHARPGRFSDSALDGYLLGEVIGHGGMGEVYRAESIATSQMVAVKVLHGFAALEPDHVERLIREARVTQSMKSRHIVRVLDTGRAPDGSPYLVMELLRGRDLGDLLRETRRLSLNQTIEFADQVAQALSVARGHGVVHRDLKPQNLFRTEHNGSVCWKVLDFGVSKVIGSGATLTGSTIGTPSYMAPEQARGREVDHRADVFALGVNVYRTLTGRPAFTGSDMMATLYNVVHVQPVKPSDVLRFCSPAQESAVNLVLALALAKDVERRFSSATLFAAALRDAARGHLDQRLRIDAEALLSAQPWGQDIAERTRG